MHSHKNLLLMLWQNVIMKDLKTSVPVFSRNHAVAIFEILNEVFNDIDEHTLNYL